MRTLTLGLFICGAWLSAAAGTSHAADRASAPHADSAASRDPSIVGTVGDQFITLDAVDQRIAAQLMRLRQEQYELRALALEGMLDQDVLDREARARHITVEQLIDQRVTTKVAPATGAEIDTFFTRNRGQMAGRSLEQSSAQIAETLKTGRIATARAGYVQSLRKNYHARVLLEPPRFAVSPDDDPSRGPASAPITIVEFSDFQCPFCSRGEATIDQVLAKYGDDVRLVFRDFPLSIHPHAEGAAIAGNCAREQGKYWEMSRAMFANPGKLSAADLAASAASIGLDAEKFKACMASSESRAEVQRDVADGQALGISGTPTFFVNGVMIVGAREIDVFARTIDRELERLGKAR